ncbi:exodeoxyribonuclease V subunit gamma [Lysobacter soyae]|uniref:RecBCD enzyme subunit RecC n=1 Tax=Lysobacter soyae TaxID=2764185 RepID=A0ABX8WNM4_9GAMM|nr:exodeoxyribonuclease V subunit gamma [Lysobacter sp. CJ11]QYR53024.1 exodeoxyribonuclease V subunit gamma [Lysobacter sp. CJ11]
MDLASAHGFEPFAPGQTPSGIVVLRASRLEAMVPGLFDLLRQLPPDAVLAPHTVIAAHPGMRQWLLAALARHAGPTGIVANIDVPLASTWIEAEAKRLLGRQAIQLPKYQPDHLRWRILDVLDAPARAGLSDARLARYLAPVPEDRAGELAVRRFQLADRLARIFSQYMVYRPEWLEAWQHGDFRHATRKLKHAGWQNTERELLAPLWQHLRRDAGAHRGEIITDLIHALAEDAHAPTHPLHVFGVSHLPPNELAALKAAALRRVVVFHVPDPCREYWAGLRKTTVPALHLALAEAQEETRNAGQDDVWHEDMHPLLARWGRLGRDYLLQLTENTDRILVDVRHNLDDKDVVPENRLHRVQESIRQDRIALLEGEDNRTDDASLRIHVCHTRVRELEVVRDAILDAIARQQESGHPLLPSDIAVVAPNIGAYSALIPGVFGAEADRTVWPPYAISDGSTRGVHPLFAAFAAWLAMPGSRFTANQIINLIAQPAIARAYRLGETESEAVRKWLASARASWGIDAAQRTETGAPKNHAQNSLFWALDRLMAGFVFGNTESTDTPVLYALPEEVLAPAADIHGPEAEALGSLYALLSDLRAFDQLAANSFTGPVWAQKFDAMLAKSFRIDATDAEEKKALSQLRVMVQNLANESHAAEATPRLHFDVVREVLESALDASPAKGRFLRGGITFAGMVPQRAVPFRFIAVLGLNEGEFPRRARDAGLDLMSQVHALGDRDVRSDDRWLFLETLMSAREQLHLSYLGRSASKGEPLNPASPLSELDDLLLQAWQPAPAATVRGNIDAPSPPWRVLHALQPFAAQYFTGEDPRWFSFDDRFAGIAGSPDAATLAPWVDVHSANAHIAGAADALTLQQVLAYYKDPAKFIFRTRLNTKLEDVAEEKLPEDEPLRTRFEALDSVGRRVFFSDVIPSRQVPDAAPVWLAAQGLLPMGDAGRQAWSKLRTALNEAWLQVAPLLSAGMKPRVVAVDLTLDSGVSLQGLIRQAWTDDAGNWLLLDYKDDKGERLKKPKDLDFKVKVPLFVEWAALRLALPDDANLCCVLPHGKDKAPTWTERLNAWQSQFARADAQMRERLKSDLRQRLSQLVQWAQSAAQTPVAYFPKASSVALADGDVAGVWSGGESSKGESQYSTYVRLLGRGQSFKRDSASHAELQARAIALQTLIDIEVNA